MSTKRRGRKAVVRKDPPTRSPDGHRPWDKLVNADPEMHYTYSDPGNQGVGGVAFYESLGYEQVIKTEGGVRSVLDAKGDAGGVVTSLHQVLMAIPKGDPDDPQPGTKAYLDAPGQAEADRMEARIVNKRGTGVDTLRGRQSEHFGFVNMTSGNYVEGRV